MRQLVNPQIIVIWISSSSWLHGALKWISAHVQLAVLQLLVHIYVCCFQWRALIAHCTLLLRTIQQTVSNYSWWSIYLSIYLYLLFLNFYHLIPNDETHRLLYKEILQKVVWQFPTGRSFRAWSIFGDIPVSDVRAGVSHLLLRAKEPVFLQDWLECHNNFLPYVLSDIII